MAADLSALTGANRDAAAALTSLFKSYGLETLAPKIVGFIQQGMGSDAISLELQNTTEYKQRFAANDQRVAAGLPSLSPSEYLATERSYRQIMANAGLPQGFYDTPADFQKFLAQDISPTELKQRVDTATEAINKAPKDTLDYMKQYYNIGDLVAFALDPTKAEPLVEQRIKSAEAGAYAGSQGIKLDQATAEAVGQQGFSSQQLQSGFGQAASTAKAADKLSQIYGGGVTQDDVVKDVFLNDSTAGDKVKKLSSQERAAFGGSTGANRTSLTSESGL